jgi:protein-tyrosine-phosphatase
MAYTVLIVCSGNTCRSTDAEALHAVARSSESATLGDCA